MSKTFLILFTSLSVILQALLCSLVIDLEASNIDITRFRNDQTSFNTQVVFAINFILSTIQKK